MRYSTMLKTLSISFTINLPIFIRILKNYIQIWLNSHSTVNTSVAVSQTLMKNSSTSSKEYITFLIINSWSLISRYSRINPNSGSMWQIFQNALRTIFDIFLFMHKEHFNKCSNLIARSIQQYLSSLGFQKLKIILLKVLWSDRIRD